MKNPKQILTVALVAILVVFFCFSKTNASINESFTFQGKIVDDDGTNLTNSDATCVNDSGADTCDFRVSLYDATTGGNLLWQETKQDIEIGDNDGIFNLTLDCAGTFSNCYQGAYDDTIFSNGTDIYIQIEFDPDGDNDYAEGETFSPRREMSSVPYAFHSKTADSATDSDTLDSIDSTSFLRSDLSDTFDSGNTLTFAGDIDSNGQISIADTDITLDGASTNLTATGDFSVNTDDLFIDKATGRVGIGDSTPSFTLDINGDAQIQGGELYLTGITSSSSTTEGTMYYDNDDDNLYVYADGSWVDLTVQGGGSSLWTDGTNGYYSNTEGIIVGPDTAETLDNTGFTLSAGDLFVSDQLGVEGNIYTDGEFISGASLHLSDNHILDTNGDINIQADNDTDDYLRIDTTSDLPTIYWEGVSTYTNDPGIGIDAGGNLVYRDQDETNWRTLDSLHNSGDFSNGGEATGAVRSLGNTDNYALTLKTNDTERVYITEGETGADPYTTLLIHSDTTDGSTIFTDSSNSGHTITSGGFAPYDAHHETDQKKFGASSIEFNIKDSLDIADHSDFQFGSTPFTIDTWVYLTKVSTSQIIVTKNSGSSSYPGWNIQVAESSGLLYFTTNNNSTLVSSSNPVSLNQWSHIAVTFDGSTLYLFIDGNLENTLSISSIQDYAGSVQIGYLNTTHNLDAGYIDEFRISKGIARWTTNFSPPGAPYSGADLGAKVGIGTTSPNATLDVELSATGISTDKTIFTANTTGSTFDTSVQSLTNYTSYLTNTSTESAGTNDLTNIALYASASGADNNYAAIFENGSVGIGTTSPNHTLDVNGNIGLATSSYINWGSTDGSSGYGFRDNSGTMEFKNSAGSWTAFGSGGSSLWTDGTNGYYSNTEGIIVGGDGAFSYVTAAGLGDLKVDDDAEIGDDFFVGGDTVIGASTASSETLSNTGFTMGGDDLFVAGMAGIEGDVYTDGSFISGASLHLSDSAILDTNGDINIQADNDTDDYLRIDTTSDLPTIYWEGVSTYTNDPGIGVDASGNLVYRDQDETSWRTLDSLHNSGDFANNGEAAGGSRGLGNTDNYALSLKTNDTERIYIGPGEIRADANSVLLIHSDDTDGSTIFTDSSNSGHTVTPNGVDVYHETDQKKFGASSIYFDGDISDYLDVESSTDWVFGTGEFAIDFWIYPTVGGVNQHIIGQYSQGTVNDAYWNVIRTSSNYIEFRNRGGGSLCSTNVAVSNNTWTHVAASRDSSGNLYVFLNGDLKNTCSGFSNNFSGNSTVYIGKNQAGGQDWRYTGYLDEIRISKGDSRWTTNFSPPGAPYSGADLGAKVGIGTTSPNATLDVELSATGISTDKTIFTANTTGSTFDTSTQSLTNYSAYLTNTSTELAGTNDLTNIALYASASGADNNYAAIFENGKVGIGTTSPNHTLDVNGNIGLATSSYINWGSTDGSSGYGFRDNSGTMEFKNSAGSWTAFGSGGSSLWTDGTNGYYSNTEGIIVGPDTAETLDNTGFTLSAGDLFVSDQLGVEGNIYTDGSFYMDGGEIEQKAGDPTLAGSLIDSINTNGAFSVYISGKYAYVAGFFSDSLAIVDISDPTSPTLAGSLSDSTNMDNPRSVYVSGKYAYVAGGDSNSLAIVDISDPTSPTLAGSLSDSTNMNAPSSVYVSGKYAYVAGGGSDSLAIVDISDPTSPTLAGSLVDSVNTDGASSVYVSGQYTYVTGYSSDSLAIVDISDPTSPTLAGSLVDSTNLDDATSVYISGKYAYIASQISDSLAIVDISDPTSPTLAGSLSDSTNMDNPRSVYVSGKYAYVAGGDSNSLAIVDISDPTSPTLAGSLVDSTNMDYPRSVYISGKYAYVAGGDSDSLAILDISGIQAPAATIGDLNTSTLDVTENASIANDLYVNNGLMVGTGGILSSGPTSTNTDLPTNYATTVKNNGNNTNRYGMLISAGEDSGSGTLIQFNDGDGTDVGEITFSGTTTTYGTSSDRRMKENIISTSMGIEDLMKVQVRDYEFKSDNTDMTYTGFIAQELIEVFPHAVFAPDDGRMWSVDYGKITPLLAKAIQDQQGMIDNLNNITTDLTTSLTDQTTTNQEKFTIIGESITELTNELNNYQTETNNSLTTLTTTIENLNDLTTLMTDTLTNHEERIQNLEAQISNLTGNPIDPDNPTNNLTTIPDNLNILSNKLTTETIITTEIDPETGEEITTESYLFDVEGNLKAKALITDKVSLDESSKEENEKTIGTAIIEAGMNEVLVTTDAINPNSKVFVTVTSEIPVLWSIAERKDGELEEQKSFKIRIAEPVTEMINFDWWIVEAK